MNNKDDNYKFQHELPKDKNSLTGKVSTPLCLAELLTKLLGINEAEAGKIIYDTCIGVGALSSYVDNKHVLIGDDLEKEYLKITQKNNPNAILFHHNTLACQKTVPCYEHLISKKWKAKVEQEISRRENELDETEIRKEVEQINALNLTEEQIKEMLEKQELALRQKTLEWLIRQEVENKKKYE
ncbi:MAG: hypothetical protein MRERV_11c064 [Mycoplasmataceae bacterium RV_VA103A]|nr:MAG: hypothetical protein MRERV_11c064 [Mycoplasmataceae bacterium RV_VA103A]